jgi:aspartokinase/homoserine dehydrogenase 1
MQILKIDGQLLCSRDGIQKAIDVLSNMEKKPSAILIGGSRDIQLSLRNIALASIDKNKDFSSDLLETEAKLLQLTREILPVQNQSGSLSYVRQQFNRIDDLCKGIQLLGESTAKTIESILTYPAQIQTHLFHSACMHAGIPVVLKEKPEPVKDEIIILPDTGSYHSPLQALINDKTSGFTVWSDGNIFSTADPEAVLQARVIPLMTYAEALELLPQDQDVLGVQALALAASRHVGLTTINFNATVAEKTFIGEPIRKEESMVTGISCKPGIALVNLEGGGMIGVPGFAKRVFATLHDEGINVILISQGASEHSICVAVDNQNAKAAEEKLSAAFQTEISKGIIQPVKIMSDVAIIGLAGENMRNHPGVSGRMFRALGRNGINILAIAQGSNERNISAVVKESDRIKSLNVLHESFFGHTRKEINLFIVGTGNVGKKLIGQIKEQQEKLLTQNLKLKVAGLINSRKMLINPDGIKLDNWESDLQSGETADSSLFCQSMLALNLRNAVLVDVTANEKIPSLYADVLKRSMSVVACNKIAASDRYEKYKQLKELAISYNCKFLFETNVGAALPVIGTLNDLISSGDNIKGIEAVLSGTLNYVFNHYDGSKPFAEVVRDAQDEGYTEPDPRLDLSGTDVMRKIMILARESGFPIEMEQITCRSFLPESCTKGTVDDFYTEMKRHENHFRQLLDEASAVGAKLKFVARFAEGKASVGLQHIQPESEIYCTLQNRAL